MPKINRNETQLRKRLVVALRAALRKIDPDSLVQDVHGVSEFGLDIIFLTKDFSGEKRCFGMQLKSGGISCQNKPNKGVKEIIGQLTIATGHNYNFQADNTYEFSGFYVVTDQEISEVAKQYISAAFKQGKPIYYLYGTRLEQFLLENDPSDLTTE